MSLATRCTHCGTIFKVVQDQLKVSEGWVRCGRCHEVFNALPSLFDLDSEAPPPRASAAATQPSPVAAPQPTATARPNEPLVEPRTTTHPAGTPFSAQFSQPSAPLPAATDFDLDTSVHLPEPTLPNAGMLPPQEVPDTDEADALDSRFLLPSRDGQRQIRRPPGPDFADAQFPSDAMQDAEDDWVASMPADLQADLPPEWHAPTPDAHAAEFLQPDTPSGRTASGTPLPPATGSLLRAPSPAQGSTGLGQDEEDTQPEAIAGMATPAPTRLSTDFVPEQAQVQPPPSLRKGRSGTRGRDPATKTPEFVKRAQRQAFWRHPATRGVLLTLALLLSLSLGLQLAHQFRDLVAAYVPEARPWLTAWCEEVGCQIQPPLHIEVLQVDSATLLRTASEGSDRYRLTVSVHNRSDIEVAWPHIDLSLTDERGTVIARRAFQTSDARMLRSDAPNPGSALMPPPSTVPQQQSTTLQWSLKLDNLQPAGYTAELFYP